MDYESVQVPVGNVAVVTLSLRSLLRLTSVGAEVVA